MVNVLMQAAGAAAIAAFAGMWCAEDAPQPQHDLDTQLGWPNKPTCWLASSLTELIRGSVCAECVFVCKSILTAVSSSPGSAVVTY